MDSNASSNTLPPVEGDVNDDNEIKIDSHCRELDGAKFGAFHVRTILVSGAGFLTGEVILI